MATNKSVVLKQTRQMFEGNYLWGTYRNRFKSLFTNQTIKSFPFYQTYNPNTETMGVFNINQAFNLPDSSRGKIAR